MKMDQYPMTINLDVKGGWRRVWLAVLASLATGALIFGLGAWLASVPTRPRVYVVHFDGAPDCEAGKMTMAKVFYFRKNARPDGVPGLARGWHYQIDLMSPVGPHPTRAEAVKAAQIAANIEQARTALLSDPKVRIGSAVMRDYLDERKR